jgi:hypothetical protein
MRPEHAPYLSKGATINTRATYFDEYGRLAWYVGTFGGDAATARVLGVVRKRVGREWEVRYEDGDILTVPEEELELAGETRSRLDTQLENAYHFQEHGGADGSGVGGSAAAGLAGDDTRQDEEMPLACLAAVAENRVQPSHLGTSLLNVPSDDESYSNESSEEDEERKEHIWKRKCVVVLRAAASVGVGAGADTDADAGAVGILAL